MVTRWIGRRNVVVGAVVPAETAPASHSLPMLGRRAILSERGGVDDALSGGGKRLFITERKGNIHWNVPSRVEAS